MKNIDLNRVLVIDIETAPAYPHFNELPENWKKLWEKKAAVLKKDPDQTAADIYNRAGIYAEFGKIICISCGYFHGDTFRVKSFYGDDEKTILNDFTRMLDLPSGKSEWQLCAHNGKEFDFPYIARRCLILGVPIPDILQLAGKKPWEIQHLDTMDYWKFGDFKSYTSLELLAAVFHIPTPKDDIDGSMVWQVYWQEHNINRIRTYCEKDVVTLANILLRFVGEDLLKPEQVRNV